MNTSPRSESHSETGSTAPVEPLLPGSTIGVLGGGQLGRMLGQVARRMGYRVNVLAPGKDNPAGQIANLAIDADFTPPLTGTFAKGVQVVTYEFENIPLEAVEAAAERAPVRPGLRALEIGQNRRLEKAFFADLGLPVTPTREVASAEACRQAMEELGGPCVLKTEGQGYDGKGQAVLEGPDDVETAWRALGEAAGVLERQVDLACEVSVVAARGADGSFRDYGVFENDHADHVLDVTAIGAPVSAEVAEQAVAAARRVGEALDVVGTYCLEFFVDRDGVLLVNELAPRPHNSGHLTIEAATTCQFEQQLRAICGLPLGETGFHAQAAMANVLGDLWAHGTPAWDAALGVPGVKLHVYGKREARPGRKMGHLTAVADSRDEAVARVREARQRLVGA